MYGKLDAEQWQAGRFTPICMCRSIDPILAAELRIPLPANL
jgi:hypothetical protein